MTLLSDVAGLAALAKVQADRARADEVRAANNQREAVALGAEVCGHSLPVVMNALAKVHEDYQKRLDEILARERRREIARIDSLVAQQGLPGATVTP